MFNLLRKLFRNNHTTKKVYSDLELSPAYHTIANHRDSLLPQALPQFDFLRKIKYREVAIKLYKEAIDELMPRMSEFDISQCECRGRSDAFRNAYRISFLYNGARYLFERHDFFRVEGFMAPDHFFIVSIDGEKIDETVCKVTEKFETAIRIILRNRLLSCSYQNI